MAVRKVKLPNNIVADIWDARIPGIDIEPIENSSNVITSDAVFAAIQKVSGAKISYGTTSYWQEHISYIPEKGEIVIYTDHDSVVINNESVLVPGFKVGDGNAYGIDLPFADDAIWQRLMNHINNQKIHITEIERESWNSKLYLNDKPVVNNNLFLMSD